MQPHLRRLQDEYGDRLRMRYKMGGLLPSWTMYNDNTNSIRKPIQMGPEWLHARNTTGVFMNDRIWITDPPASSFPACIAVKSAELQSAEYGVRYLDLARTAVMVNQRNIARLPVLLDLAADLARLERDFDYELFREDLQGRGVEAFRSDWKDVKYRGIQRFPTLIFRYPDGRAIMLSGYQPYETLEKAMITPE